MGFFEKELVISRDAGIDLHMHTAYSDGRWTAEKLVMYLAKEQFSLVAITDHDRIDMLGSIQALALRYRLPVIMGVEISAQWHGRRADLLCYGFNGEERNALSVLVDSIRENQIQNAYRTCENLRRMGYEIPAVDTLFSNYEAILLCDVLRQGIERSMIVSLEKRNIAPPDTSVLHEIMKRAGFEIERVELGKAVEAAHESKALCLIAHPGRSGGGFAPYDPILLEQLRAEIAIDGIEVYHPSHSKESVICYLEYVHTHNLLMSTGSDAHCFSTAHLPMKYPAHLSDRLLNRLGIVLE